MVDDGGDLHAQEVEGGGGHQQTAVVLLLGLSLPLEVRSRVAVDLRDKRLRLSTSGWVHGLLILC